MRIINMKKINELYKSRRKKYIKAVIFGFLIPSPGIVVESLVEAKKIDDQIREMVQNPEDVDDENHVVICRNSNA